MRELPEDEAREVCERRALEPSEDKGEKWFTFEHSPAWREVERQFMGAVRSHGGLRSTLVLTGLDAELQTRTS